VAFGALLLALGLAEGRIVKRLTGPQTAAGLLAALPTDKRLR
jgi:hypothetical protein